MNSFETPLPGVELELGGAIVRVLDQGAQVVDWTPSGSAPVLFASAAAVHEPGRHVRAGAPLIFPWFGLGRNGDRTPVHGYARLRPFRRVRIETSPDSASTHHLLEPEQQDDLPAPLEVTTTIDADGLSIALTVTNLSVQPINYELGLHTYLAVGDVRQASVADLGGSTYLDRLTNTEQAQTGVLTVDGEIDRAYRHTGSVTVEDPVLRRRLRVDKSGSHTTIVWNPGPQKARTFPDLADDEWSRLLCVEAAEVGGDAGPLSPSQSRTLSQHISVTQC